MKKYQPPVTLTPRMLSLVADISEELGRLSALGEVSQAPMLRRGNRIRTIQASLAIENNTLSVEQVTAVLDGQRVLGLPREIQEVRNAFAAYEAMTEWRPSNCVDLLAAHNLLMQGLIDDAGCFRQGGVGIYRGNRLLHMAPPANRVRTLIDDLLGWVATAQVHPLIASCIFHYEFEFIHPFANGNGRMGRLWQTLMLSQWRPMLAYLPVETVIREQQEAYYAALAAADQLAEATPFVEFMLNALQQALAEAAASSIQSVEPTAQATAQVAAQVTDQVRRLLDALRIGQALGAAELIEHLGLTHRQSFRNSYLNPALVAGLIQMTKPASPRSPAQAYYLTDKARLLLSGKPPAATLNPPNNGAQP
ncbi:Fic family protein [Pseudomonas syringae]|uniref:Fic family protein n=1 Tax=Pseudomonas syringae TaxID=317 RepID=A0A1C7Z4A2_PSESX|nr:Fic family protein [Pseudomonas syringae]OCR23980.1 Fic family protein [Pseudomonas syringae]